jgi:hypothetical protein
MIRFFHLTVTVSSACEHSCETKVVWKCQNIRNLKNALDQWVILAVKVIVKQSMMSQSKITHSVVDRTGIQMGGHALSFYAAKYAAFCGLLKSSPRNQNIYRKFTKWVLRPVTSTKQVVFYIRKTT